MLIFVTLEGGRKVLRSQQNFSTFCDSRIRTDLDACDFKVLEHDMSPTLSF